MGKNQKVFAFLVGLLLSFCASAKKFNLNPLRFTNRAQCAVDSKSPTQSAFLVVNNIDPGRAVYKLAKVTGSDPKSLTKEGILVFRYTVVNLFNIIHNKLVERRLPILSHDTTLKEINLNHLSNRRKKDPVFHHDTMFEETFYVHHPSKYKKYTSKCSGESSCGDLNNYISNLWKNSERYKSPAKVVVENYKVDNFHSKKSYLRSTDFEKKGHELYCHYLKKFSPLQAHLFGTRPSRKAYEKFGVALDQIDEYMGDCNDFESQENLKVAAYQFDISGLGDEEWEIKGFDYWHSMKMYFAWAFRNADVMKKLSNQFYHVFRGLEIENLVMFIPNGCKSVASPKCDGGLLSKSAIREFAKSDFKRKALDLDLFDGIPEGPEEDLVTDPFTEVNTDILDLSDHDTAASWAENMVGNLSGTRNKIKNNLVKAVNFINILYRHFPLQKFEGKFKEYFKEILIESSDNPEKKNELYYLCSEYYFVAHETFSTVNGKLELLKETKVLDNMILKFSKENISDLFDYFDSFSKEVVSLCSDLRQKEIFDDEFKLNKEGYQQWYLDKVAKNLKIVSLYKDQQQIKIPSVEKPLIAYKGYEKSPILENAVCLDPIHCARELAKSVIDIYRATVYASALWAKKGEIASASTFNPYKERWACKVYDPWFKTKSMIFNLFSDIGQAALSFTTPGMIYGRVGLRPGRVVSFKQLVREGMIEYDPQITEERAVVGLAADFGPLLGVPCKVSVSNTANNPYDAFRFVGVSVGTCVEKEEHQTIANSGSDINYMPVIDRSACAGCQLDFEGVATSLTHVAQNVGPIYFLVRAFVRLFKGLKDPHNIPRDWIAKPNHVYDTFKRYGYIPKRCVKKFRKGRSCK